MASLAGDANAKQPSADASTTASKETGVSQSSGAHQNGAQTSQKDGVSAASTVDGGATVSINKSIAYENLVLGHASSRGVPLKSENEEKLWSTLETRLYGDPNRQQAMPGIYVPHRIRVGKRASRR